ncbi:MAG: hypothetical protein IJJ99_09090 [Oscillospiraceae bacterium]|nr:hypothetical protein [Oscillospiraceae bacterium]
MLSILFDKPDLFTEEQIIEAIFQKGNFDDNTKKRIRRLLIEKKSVMFDIVIELCKHCAFEVFFLTKEGTRKVVQLDDFGAAVRNLRKDAKMTQDAAAVKYLLNMRTLARYEKLNADGSILVRIGDLAKYLSMFDCCFGIQIVEPNLTLRYTFMA